MNVNYTLEESTNSDITFIDLHKFLNYIIFQKENNFLDAKTQTYVNDVTEKYNLEHFVNLDLQTLKEQKYQIVNDFNNKHKIIVEKIRKLKLVEKILNIDLDYYNSQIKDINEIITNSDFKNEISDITDKMSNQENLTTEELNKLSFHQELLKQKNYIKNIILSDTQMFASKQKDIIKNKLVEHMKLIEEETKIYLREANLDQKINYNEVMDTWNTDTLIQLTKKINMTHSSKKNNMNLKYQLIESLIALTGKSYAEIILVIKDKKFKEKIFASVNLVDIVNKINQLNQENKQYIKIEQFLTQIEKVHNVCPLCNFSSDLPIDVLLHLSLHKNEDNFKPIRFHLYNDNNKLMSRFSENVVTKINDMFYHIKKQMLKSDKIKNNILESSTNIPKISNNTNIGFLQNLLPSVVDREEQIEIYKDNLMSYYKSFFVTYPELKENFVEIIDRYTNKMSDDILENEIFEEERDIINFAHNGKIINYHITRTMTNQYFQDQDISNLYNSNIQFFDNNLKNNQNIDTFFKNLIHYNTFEPILEIKSNVNSFLKIIGNTNNVGKMLFSSVTSTQYKRINKDNKAVNVKSVPVVEVTEYLDYKTLILLIPILRNRNFTLQIQELIRNDEFELNDDEDSLFKPWEWVSKSEYNKMTRLLSNIKKQDIDIKTLENDETDDLKRLHQLFLNISIKDINQIQKEFDSITKIFEGLLTKNRVVHDINMINSNKNINDKFREYIIGSYLLSVLNILKKIVTSNIDNTTNTKTEIFNMFSTLNIYLNLDSTFLLKNKNVFYQKRRTNVVNNNQEKNNKDEILNEFFESDGEEDFDDLEEHFEQEIEDDINDSETEQALNEDEEDFIDEEDLF